MDTLVQYGLIGLGVLILLHFISFRMLWNPTKYKETVTLYAARRAFLEDVDKLPEDLVPYKWHTAWTRLANVYRMKLHRDAPRKFEEARALWGVDEDQYRDEVVISFMIRFEIVMSLTRFSVNGALSALLGSLGRCSSVRNIDTIFSNR
jgi:hypothetical protein